MKTLEREYNSIISSGEKKGFRNHNNVSELYGMLCSPKNLISFKFPGISQMCLMEKTQETNFISDKFNFNST